MTAESILQKLTLLWKKMLLVFERAADIPQIISAWGRGSASLGDRVLVIVMAGTVVVLIVWLIRFFKAGFWKKIGMLLGAAFFVLAAAFLVSLTLGDGETAPAVTPMPVISGDEILHAESDDPANEPAQTAEVTAAPVRPAWTGEAYVLGRGARDPFTGHVSPYWQLHGNEIDWLIEDGVLLQLSDLDRLSDTEPFAVECLSRESDLVSVTLRRVEGDGTSGSRTFCETVLEIRIRFSSKIERMPWYAEAGSWITSGDRASYTILENNGTEVLFLCRDEDVTNENGDILTATCLARQLGDDVVTVTVRTHAFHEEDEQIFYTGTNPGVDEELKAAHLSLTATLFSRCFRLVRGLSDAGLEAILPDHLSMLAEADTPAGGCFTIPCTRLEEMSLSSDFGEVIRMEGMAPDGGRARYTILNGAALYTDVRMDYYFAWRKAYEEAEEADEEMSAFLGCRAVAYEGAWIIDAGSFYAADTDSTMENYYYLVCDVYAPAVTPEPSPGPDEIQPDAETETQPDVTPATESGGED